MLKLKINKYIASGFILIIAFLLTVSLTEITFLKNIEYKIHDFFFVGRNRIQPQPVPQDIVIVAIDEASFQELKTPWPWPRQIHARLVDNLVEAGAGIIAFDIVFADPTDPVNDKAFRDSIDKAGNVILASNLEIAEDRFILRKSLVEPLDEFTLSSLGFGLANVLPDQDNFVRRMPLEIEGEHVFAYAITKGYLAKTDSKYLNDECLYERLKIEDPTKPLIINYLGPPGSFRVVSYYQALDYKNYLPKDIFKDKIVLIGLHLEATPYTTTKTLDAFATPFFTASTSRMYGVEVQANIINTLLRNIEIKRLTFIQIIFILFIFLVLSSLLIWPYKPLKGLIFASIFIGSYIIACILLFLTRRIFLPVLFPSLQTALIYIGAVLYKYVIVERVSIYDSLTSLLNRRNLELQLEKNIKLADRYNLPLSVAMSDIDHFKSVNDTYGHQAGDFVLKKVAYLLKGNLKGHDVIGRYGGEEFCIIMPHTGLADARSALDKVRETIASTKLETGPSSITMSFGVSGLVKGDDGKSLVKRADEALYRAKESGRNRVVASS